MTLKKASSEILFGSRNLLDVKQKRVLLGVGQEKDTIPIGYRWTKVTDHPILCK